MIQVRLGPGINRRGCRPKAVSHPPCRAHMWRRTVFPMLVAGLALSLGCSKDLPSTPATPAGTPVIINGQPQLGISRNIIYKNGTVLNQSGRTIYNFRIALVVYRDDPFFTQATDTSEVKIASLDHGVTQGFSSFETMGDRFIDAFPVYEIIPPGP